MRKFIDLSHEITDAMPVYPGDPEVSVVPCADISANGYADSRLTCTLHAGTHVDAPAHMIEDGSELGDFPLSRFQGYGVLIDARHQKHIGPEVLEGHDIRSGNIVLFWTDWSQKFRTDRYYQDWPILSPECAHRLAEKGVSMVGIDTPGPDAKDEQTAHNILFTKDILILENLDNLQALRGYKLFRVLAYPLKLAGNAAPVRVVAEVG